MFVIIVMCNIVEVGGFWVLGVGGDDGGLSSFLFYILLIFLVSFIIMLLWFWFGEVLFFFFVVIGSEMVVDWVKYVFVNKFNNIKLMFYSWIFDIFCKDYYINVGIVFIFF